MKSQKSSGYSSPKETLIISDQEPETTELVNNMQQGSSNILVAIRCRPLTKKEKEVDDYKTIHILDEKVVIIIDPTANANKRTKEKKYAFDYAFGETSGQQEVFNKTTYFLIDGILNGYNATVFAYGPTGAGKTYTMLGEGDTLGIMLMSFVELFSRIENLSNERSYTVRISYLEIYNEIVRDLINPTSAFLDIREDQEKGIMIAGLTELNVVNPSEVIECLRLGNKRRTCEPTEANFTSSRSHAILQIFVDYKDKASGISADIVCGKLSLVDLAGSERASNTKNRGLRLIEGANINKSLLALGNCINALYEANLKGVKSHIPYRDSKLTRLLKDSLGGNCRTVMIVCISPFYAFFEDTHNTLKYANRAKNIKTTTERNVVNVSYHISKYQNIIKELTNEVKELRKIIKIDSEYFQKDVEDHFSKEANVKTLAFDALKAWDDTSLLLLLQENELNNEKLKNGNDNAIVKSLEESVEKLKKTQQDLEEKIKKFNSRANYLEGLRKDLEMKWGDLSKQSASNFQIIMQQNIINLNDIEQQRRRIHEENIIKQKDAYIQILQDHLKDRLDSLETQDLRKFSNPEPNESKIYQKNLDIFDGKSKKQTKVFNYRLQGGKYADMHLKSESILPPISPSYKSHLSEKQTKIPKYQPKFIEDSSSNSSTTEVNLIQSKPAKNVYKSRSKIPQKNKGKLFINNSEPESSSRPRELPKISDKFKLSPYVLKKDEAKKNAYSSKKNVKYGVMIRGLEKF